MKRALILDGAGAGDPTTEALCEVVSNELDAAGLASSVIHLRDLRLAHCQGEFDCWVKTPGVCRADDEAREIARDLHDSDLAVYLGPVTFGGYAPELKKALDRQICLVEPFFEERAGRLHHRARYDRYPALFALGWLPAPDPEQERLFSALLEANAINGCVPRHRALVASPDPATWPGAIRAAIADLLQPGHEPEPDEAQLESASFRLLDLTLPDRAPAAPRPIRRAALLVGSARPRGRQHLRVARPRPARAPRGPRRRHGALPHHGLRARRPPRAGAREAPARRRPPHPRLAPLFRQLPIPGHPRPLVEAGVVPRDAAASMAKPLIPRWIGLRLGSSLGNLYWVQKAREHGLRRDDLEARPLDGPPSR